VNPEPARPLAELSPVAPEEASSVRCLLTRARDRGQFDATPGRQRVRTIIEGPESVTRGARTTEGRFAGFASVGPLGLVGPPFAQTTFIEVVADHAETESALFDWAIAVADRCGTSEILRTLRGSASARPPGFAKVRDFWRMDCSSLNEAVPRHSDLALRTYPTAAATDTTWIGIINQAFAEHWGGYLPWTLGRWQERLETDLRDAPQLLVLRNDEPAGLLLSRILELEDGGTQPAGFIEVVATHPAHRRAGVAEYLVRSALAEFAAVEVKRAVLLVDRTSGTRPAAVYKRCGFEPTFTYDVWERAAGGRTSLGHAPSASRVASA
jgi:ribosomal protein S18 acetylase RimI-like enzyme